MNNAYYLRLLDKLVNQLRTKLFSKLFNTACNQVCKKLYQKSPMKFLIIVPIILPIIIPISMLLLHTTITARELRKPLPANPLSHYPLYHQQLQENDYFFALNSIGYYRSAEHMLNHKHKKQPYATLYFGVPSFLGQQAFYDSTVAVATNPWLNLSPITPRITYEERGALFGLIAAKQYSCTWRAGFRARLPYRSLYIHQLKMCGSKNNLGGSNLDGVIGIKPEYFNDSNGTPQAVVNYAYRMDFLSKLKFESTGAGANFSFVNYADPTFGNLITIADEDVSNSQAANPVTYPVFIIKSSSGEPTGTFGAYESSYFTTPQKLSSDGSGLAEQERAYFDRTTNYSALANQENVQKTLWLVPAIEQEAAAVTQTAEAVAIKDTLNDMLPLLDNSAEDFFAQNTICFSDIKKSGIGDLLAELFLTYQVRENLELEGSFGLSLPTGAMILPNQVFNQPLGNNGHTEVRLGLQGFWQAQDWLTLKAYGAYAFVTGRKELVAAPFKGASVKNIGEAIDAHISWQYFYGTLDCTFIKPAKNPVGLSIGYEVYAKQKDHIFIAQVTAKDFIGELRPLDANILAKRTDALAHTLRTELFITLPYAELEAGWAHTLGGKNIPQETDWYLGVIINF